MEIAAVMYISKILEKNNGEAICLGMPARAINIKVGDLFTTRYEVLLEDIVSDAIPKRRIKVKSVAIRVVKIIIDRRGTEVTEYDSSTGTGAIFHLRGDVDELYPSCSLRAGPLPQN